MQYFWLRIFYVNMRLFFVFVISVNKNQIQNVYINMVKKSCKSKPIHLFCVSNWRDSFRNQMQTSFPLLPLIVHSCIKAKFSLKLIVDGVFAFSILYQKPGCIIFICRKGHLWPSIRLSLKPSEKYFHCFRMFLEIRICINIKAFLCIRTSCPRLCCDFVF